MSNIPKLYIKQHTSDKWLENSSKVLQNFLDKLEKNYRCEILEVNPDVYSKLLVKDNFTDINKKYANLISLVLDKLNVVGIWKNTLIPNTIEPVISLKIYGSQFNVNIAHNILSYIINGLDKYYEIHVRDLKKKKHVRKVMRKKLPGDMDVRKRTNQNIKNKLEQLEYIIGGIFPFSNSKEKTKYINYVVRILEVSEKVDYKSYRGMKNPSIRSMYARKGRIYINRLV